MTFLCLLALSACEESNAGVVARASHDFNGDFELFSYQAEPSEGQEQTATSTKNQYGGTIPDIKRPSTIFMCLWRNTSYPKLDGGKPAEVFLSCSFGLTAVETPVSPLERAEMFNSIDRANLIAKWNFVNGNYRLSRFEVEILADGKRYRSQNLTADMSQIRVVQGDMEFPQNKDDSFQFDLRSRLPFRQNSGEAQRDPIVSISLSGTAEPIPSWVSY